MVKRLRSVVAAVFVALCPALTTGQTNERIYEELDFRFVTPGARSVAMGKTFVGLADDATAAFSNPAGLSNLLEQEFSLEFQATQIKHYRLVPAGDLQRFGDRVLVPSFFSYALPIKRFTLSFFRNQVQAYRESFEFPGRFIPEAEGFEDGAFGTIDEQAESYGIGLSYVVTHWLSLGLSGTWNTLDVATEGGSGTRLNEHNGSVTIDSDQSGSYIAGILVKPRRRLAIGATIYGGAHFDVNGYLRGNFKSGPGAQVTFLGGTPIPVDYVLPPRRAFGASWRVCDRFTILGDAAWVGYSRQVGSGFQIVDFRLDPQASITPANFQVPDVWEFHGGAEARFYGHPLTFSLRAGVFTDPDHQMRFVRSNDSIAQVLLDYRFNTVRPHTDTGVTFGAGVVIRNKVQFDAAASLSHDADEIVASLVIRLF